MSLQIIKRRDGKKAEDGQDASVTKNIEFVTSASLLNIFDCIVNRFGVGISPTV